MNNNDELTRLAQAVGQGKLSRRDFLKTALMLGVSSAAASGILAACGGQAPAPAATSAPVATSVPASTSAPAQPTAADIGGDLTVWGWANDMLRATAAAFNEKYPNVKFNFVDMSWQDSHQKLAVALAAGSGAPDVMSLDGAQMQHFVRIGGLLDITKEMQPLAKDFPAYKIREASDDKGNIFAVPWDIGPVSLFYRKDILEKAGVTPPVTWDEYISAGQKLAKNGNYMMALSVTSPQPQDVGFFQKLLWQAGGSYFDQKTGAVTLDNDAGLKAMEMYARVALAGITLDVAPFTPAWFGAWKEDKIVTEPGAGWMLHVFSDNVKEGEGGYGQWRIADQLPAYEKGGAITSNLGGSNIVVTGQTKNAAAATAYALYTAASADGQVIMAQKGTFPSFLPSHQDPRMADATAGVYGDQKFNQPFIKLTPLVPNTFWRDSAFPEADVIVNAGLANVLGKRWTPKEASKAIADQIRAATLRP